jgi:lysozyme family protein
MADFNHFLPGLMSREGGYVDNPADPGKETYAGVARAYNPQWRGWAIVDAAKTKLGLHSPVPFVKYAAINKELAGNAEIKMLIRAFYKASYWDALYLDAITSQVLAEQMCDHGTNAGTSRPAKMIQFAVNQVIAAEKLDADDIGAGEKMTPLVVDGQLGPKTIAAINAIDQAKLLKAFVQLRRDYYEYRTGVRIPAPDVVALLKSLRVAPDPTQKVFLKSWLARLPKL